MRIPMSGRAVSALALMLVLVSAVPTPPRAWTNEASKWVASAGDATNSIVDRLLQAAMDDDDDGHHDYVGLAPLGVLAVKNESAEMRDHEGPMHERGEGGPGAWGQTERCSC